jgi:hypothetical protein
MTAPKDGTKHRIIVDLFFPSPEGHAVNLSVNKNSYVRTPFSLRLPTVNTICQVLNIVGNILKQILSKLGPCILTITCGSF